MIAVRRSMCGCDQPKRSQFYPDEVSPTVVQLGWGCVKRLSYDGKLIDFKKDFLA